MSFVRCFFFVFLFIVIDRADCLGACSYDVTECMTRGAQVIYNALVAGVKDLIEPIDPLHLEVVDAELNSFRYHVTNATMNGLRDCTVQLFKPDKLSFNFEFNIYCPKLIFTYNFDAKGKLLSNVDFDGKGFGTVTMDDYVIRIKGKFQEMISLKDQRIHMSIVSHFIETELKGRLTFVTEDLLYPDKTKSDLVYAAINNNYKVMEETYIRSPFLENFMAIFVSRLNTYLSNNPLETIFKNEEKNVLLDVTRIRLP